MGDPDFQIIELQADLAIDLLSELVHDTWIDGTAISVATALMFHPTASAETLSSYLGIGLESARGALRALSDRRYLERCMIRRGQRTRLMTSLGNIVISADRRW